LKYCLVSLKIFIWVTNMNLDILRNVFMKGINVIKMNMIHWKLNMHGCHELIVSSNDMTMLILDQMSVMPWKILLLNSWKNMN